MASVAGCKPNACAGRPAEAQIDVRLRLAKDAAVTTRVALKVNGSPALVRVFYVASPSFRFSFGDLDQPPRKLEISVVVSDRFGGVVAQGAGAFTFAPNGCNFFTLETRALDAGGMVDALASDAPSD